MDKSKKWSLGNKLFFLILSAVCCFFVLFAFALGYATMNVAKKQAVEAESRHVTIVVDLIELFEKSKYNEVARFSDLFASYFTAPIKVDPGLTSKIGLMKVPTLTVNGRSLHFEHMIPDHFSKQSGEVATIFAKSGHDFVRISTSLRKRNGKRAVGTWLKRTHPSYKLLLQGRSYAGIATLFGTRYMTEYHPIFNENKDVIGVRFVGVDVTKDIAELKEKLSSIKLAQTGFLYILNASEKRGRGDLIYHPTEEGANILSETDANGEQYIKAMLADKVGSASITLQTERGVEKMLVAYKYLKSRKWLVVAQVPEAEMTSDIVDMRNLYALMAFVLLISIALILYFLVRRMISNPLRNIVQTAGRLSEEELLETKIQTGRGEFEIVMDTIENMASDIAERKEIERALRLTQFSVNQAETPILWITSDGRIYFANDAACSLLACSQKESTTFTCTQFLKENYARKWSQYWALLRTNRSLDFESQLVTNKKQIISVEINANYVDYEGQEFCCAFVHDITEKKQTKDLIWTQANFDSLTGLPNRRQFLEQLNYQMRQVTRTGMNLALLFIDLDDFKNVNDSYGHGTGDVLLKEVAFRLGKCVRESDSISRLGGDEFTVVMGSVEGREDIDRVCERILTSLTHPFHLGSDKVAHISASIGITLYPNDSQLLSDLLVNADQAMYAAKLQGRQQYCYFTPQMQIEARARQLVMKELRIAIDEDQMRLVYQPIIDLVSGEVVKAEALIRWEHPLKGLISPAEFIPVAEESGLIHDLGNWVFETAAEKIHEWRKNLSSDLKVSINISPVQFRMKDGKISGWSEYLAQKNFDGLGIVAEITEGLLLDMEAEVAEQFRVLRDASVQFALDDFGTGYSSLSYLKKIDIDYIKIDRAFVSGLGENSEDLVLCEAMIVMAHKLNIQVIAEGVETLAQYTLLKNAGCDYAQGYLFSPGISDVAFSDAYQAHGARWATEKLDI